MESGVELSLPALVKRKFALSSFASAERGIQVAMVLGVIGAWEALGRADLLYGLIPTFGATVKAAWVITSTGKIWPDIVTSSYEIGMGTAIALICGLVAGLAVASVDYLRKVFEPLVVYLGSIPKIILFPIALLFVGIGPESKVALGAISGFVPIALNVMVGFREVDQRYVKMAKSKGASHFQLYRKVYLPAMIYPIFAGVRLGVGVAIVGTLLGETKVANHGLGFMADHYYDQFAVAEMYAVLLIIFVGAACINLIMTAILSRLTRFKASEVEERRTIL